MHISYWSDSAIVTSVGELSEKQVQFKCNDITYIGYINQVNKLTVNVPVISGVTDQQVKNSFCFPGGPTRAKVEAPLGISNLSYVIAQQ